MFFGSRKGLLCRYFNVKRSLHVLGTQPVAIAHPIKDSVSSLGGENAASSVWGLVCLSAIHQPHNDPSQESRSSTNGRERYDPNLFRQRAIAESEVSDYATKQRAQDRC